jgi:hypothetical protein
MRTGEDIFSNRAGPTNAASICQHFRRIGGHHEGRLGIVGNNEPEKAPEPMRIKAVRLIFCLASACLAAGCASSNSAGPEVSTVDKTFLRGIGSYDDNRDGVVTCDEWRASAVNLFTKANKSGSGALTEAEFQTLATTDRTFLTANARYYDVNGDNKIDRKEFVDRPNPAFTHADKDNDCRLTEPELIVVRNLSAAPAPTTARPSAIGTGAPAGSGGGY